MPSGKPFGPVPAGRVTQGVQAKVQIELKRGSPVEPSPSGASPAALGVEQHVDIARRCRRDGGGTLRRFRAPRHRRRAAIRGRGSAPCRATPGSPGRGAPRIRRRSCAPPRIEDAAVMVEDVGEFGRERDLAHPGAGRGTAPSARAVRAALACRHRRASQAGVRQKPMRGAADRAVDRAMRHPEQGAARNSAMSSSAAAMMPSVSRLWHCILMPPRLNSPKLGL